MHTTVIVQDRCGSARENKRVQLMLLHGSFTEEVYTNTEGRAVIFHDKDGMAKVYIAGNGCVGEYRIPDTIIVTI